MLSNTPRKIGISPKRLAKLRAKVSDTRADFLQKLSSQIVRENQTIFLEDLNVSPNG